MKPKYVIAYHGGSEPIRRFDPKLGAQGLMWFSEDRDKIVRGESGAVSTRYLMTVRLKVRKVAGWEEYDRLMLAQIFSKTYGFDAIRLDHGEDGADWALRDPKRVEVVKIEERPTGGWSKAGRASGSKSVLFHVTKSKNRASILKNGLMAAKGWTSGPGIYLTTNPAGFFHYFEQGGVYESSSIDVWEVDTAGLPVVDDDDETATLGEDYKVVGVKSIPPSRLKLAQTYALTE